MSDIKDWKDTAASNNASPPDGWPEGQAPSTVNNCAREMMRAIRVKWENAGFFDWGLTYSLKSQNKLRISDQSAGSSYAATDVYSVGQRVKIVSNNATVYGSVTTLSSSSTAVIIDITCDSGTLTSTITSVEASILYPGENPISGYNAIDQNSSQIYGADGGAADAYTLTLDPAPTAYAAGQVFSFNATNANTGASTLNVNGLGVKTIKKLHDQDVASGDIEAGQVVTVIYDGTNFQMQSQLASSGSGTAATQAEMEAATSTTTYASPGRTQYHPGVAKAWIELYHNSGTPTSLINYNVSSITDTATGRFSLNWSTNFSSVNYCSPGAGESDNSTYNTNIQIDNSVTRTTGAAAYRNTDPGVGAVDLRESGNIAVFGDQ